MGLFDKLLGPQQSDTFSEQDALAGILLSIAAADGNLSDEETGAFMSVINRMQMFREQSEAQHSLMIEKLFNVLRRDGAESLLQRAASALPSEMRQTAFAIAVDLTLADGTAEAEERAMLESLQKQLEISDDFAMKAVEVISVKNRG